MDRIDAPISKRTVRSADGTVITYFVAGKGPAVWVIPPGLGTPLISWKYIFEEFQDAYTLVTWDMRGLYESETPKDPNALTIERHAEDLEAIAAQERLDGFVLGGWSLAVQISLEYYHRHPEKVTGLILINGAYEHVLSTAFAIPGANALFTGVLKLGQKLSPVFNPLVSFLLGMDRAVDVIKSIGLVTNNYDFFGEMVREFGRLDWDVYFRMLLLVNKHSAAPYLPEVRVPTLITAGAKDAMTPVSTAKKLQSAISGAALFIIPNGTHYTVAEYPEILNLRIERFLRDLDPEPFSSVKC